MRPLKDYPPEVWDRFFDFLADGTADLTDEEVRRELAEAGIDMRPAVARLLKLIEAHRATRRPTQLPAEGPEAESVERVRNRPR